MPDGRILRRRDLPGAGETHWTAKRKALVVVAVCHGLVPADEARAIWDLSREELGLWVEAYLRSGTAGLRSKALNRRIRGGKPARGRRG